MPSGVVNEKIQDEGRLAELGYTQELLRDWGWLQNFGASFSIINVTCGVTTLFGYGLNTGGPAVMTVGWIVVNFFTLLIGASMAEILSSIPTSGGPYFWAYMLAPQPLAPFFSWITGWFNLLGQISVTTAIDFGLANLISLTAQVSDGYSPSAGKTLGILAVILVSHVLINFMSIRKLRYAINASILLNTIGVICLGIAVLAKAPSHQPAKFVFAKFYDGTGVGTAEGWSERASPVYVAAIGILLAQYTITGYDASAHLCEETKKAVRDAPMGLISAIAGSAFMGLFLLCAFLFSIQDFDTVRNAPQPVLQILQDACGPRGGTVLMVLIMLCVWQAGLFSLTSNSRMMFSFARDGGIPHRLHIIDRGFKSPIRTVMFGASCSFLLALPSLGSSVAFNGTTSIATIGLYISYGIPIALALIFPRNYKRGPFSLGRYSKYVQVIAIIWIAFIAVVFCLPAENPVTSKTLNYTPVAVGIVAAFAFGSWFLWARKWFTGRCRHHCVVCIRQLDFLGEEMVFRADTDDQHLKSEEAGRFTPSEEGGFHSSPIKTIGKGDNKISVGREFEVYSAPAREYEEMSG